MKCENPMVMVRVGDKYRFVGAVKDMPAVRLRKYLYSPDGRYIVNSCKQCFACRLNRARNKAVRGVLESLMHEDNCFITLTYADEHLPEDYSLHKKEFQDFMKRLRKNTGRKMRYMMCGEYGDSFGRPHYHAILFGYKPDDLVLYKIACGNNLYTSATLSKAWQNKGWCVVGNVTYDSVSYVARYIEKKYTGEMAKDVYGDRQPPYSLQSTKPGLGYDYLMTYGKNMYEKDFIVIRDGLKVKPPEYFDRIFDREFCNDYPVFDEIIKPRRIEQAEIAFCKNPQEYSFDSITRKGRFQRVKHRHDRRDYVEE